MILRLTQPIVRSVIRADLLKGLTRNAVWNLLPTHNFPKFHKQTYWRVATQLLAEVRKEPQVRAYPGNVKLTHDIMVEGDFPYDAKYNIRVKGTLYDPDTDKYLVKDMQLYSDANLGKDGWLGQFMKKWYPEYGQEGLELVDAEINLVIHQRGYPY